MIPIDDPLKCRYADEWDKKTLGDAIETFMWTPGELPDLKSNSSERYCMLCFTLKNS